MTPAGTARVISRQVLHVELSETGEARHPRYAPYLDYRPLAPGEPGPEEILAWPECAWIGAGIEGRAMRHAVSVVVPRHLEEVREHRLPAIKATKAAVHDRLTKERAYWDHRAQELKLKEATGGQAAKLNHQEAQRRAEEMEARRQQRMTELELEEGISAVKPRLLGAVLVVPMGLLAKMSGQVVPTAAAVDTQAAAAAAREAVMEVERRLGFDPVDREQEKLGYDIESSVPGTGKLRFIEVKGRAAGAATVTVTKNEILFSLNEPEDFILALVELDPGKAPVVRYLRKPFSAEPDFNAYSVNYDLAALMAIAEEPS